MTLIDHAVYALLWLSFGILHSLLADQRVKRSLRQAFGSGYRLAYNLFATAHFALVFFIGHRWLGENAAEFALPQSWLLASIGIQLAGLGIILIALSHYDLGRFSGKTQIRKGEQSPDDEGKVEQLHTGGLHRWVRHPLYLGIFLILWARATDEFALATAIWASVYVVIGARLEEGRLIDLYGDDYRAYRSKVPMFVPRSIFPT